MTSIFRRHSRGRPPHPDVLTRAEWRVLEEVRAGRSNPEIAERLGLSRNTVKTHISSILAKLELRDRGDLAAWPGEPARIGRTPLFAPLGWVASRAEIAAMTVVVAVVVAGFAVALQPGAVNSGESEPPPLAGGATEPPLKQTPPPLPTASPTPAAVQALFPTLTVGPPIELPEDIALYVWEGCTSCDTPSTALRRFERVGGTVQEVSLFERTINTPYIHSGWVEPDALYIAECSAGYCGGVGERTADAAVTLYRSSDEGATWESLGEQPVPAGLMVANPDPAYWGITSTLPVAQPTSVDGVWEVDGVELDLRALDSRGVPEQPGTVAYYLLGRVDVDAQGRLVVRWQVKVPGGQTVGYLSIFEPGGTVAATYEFHNGAVWLDTDHLIGTVVYDPHGLYQSPDIEYGWIPSIIDLRDGSVRPILDPFGSEPLNRNTVVGVQPR